MAVIDLDKGRAARREAKKKGPRVKIAGKTYELSVELPFPVLEAFAKFAEGAGAVGEDANGVLVEVAKALLGEHYAEIAPHLLVGDIEELISGIMAEYGLADPLGSSAS